MHRNLKCVCTRVGGTVEVQPADVQPGGSHVDGVSVLLAQRLVFLGVERLTLQVHVADLHGDNGLSVSLPTGPEHTCRVVLTAQTKQVSCQV